MQTEPSKALFKPRDDGSLAALLKQPAYADRFRDVLRDSAPQFVSSILSIGATMRDVEPKSIIGSAMTAAALNLPIDKNLGFAWIIPYNNKGTKVAQFQMGYKGIVQLALRTSQYARINAKPINAEAFGGFDDVGEPKILWEKVDETKPVVGYALAWKLVTGFVKTCYWTKEKVEAHARKYSQSFRSGYDSPWKSHFDQMAMKTVIKNELSDWGILSVSIVKAIQSDQAVIVDIDAVPEYVDNPGDDAGPVKPKFREKKIKDAEPAPVTEPTATDFPTEEGASEFAPVEQKQAQEAAKADGPMSPQEELADFVVSNGFTMDDFLQMASRETLIEQTEIDSIDSFENMKLSTVKKLLRMKVGMLGALKAGKEA